MENIVFKHIVVDVVQKYSQIWTIDLIVSKTKSLMHIHDSGV